MGITITIDNLDDMCALMCDNRITGGRRMGSGTNSGRTPAKPARITGINNDEGLWEKARPAIERILAEESGNLYDRTTTMLDIIADRLDREENIDATWQGRSIYIGNDRVASMEMVKEGPDAIGILKYRTINPVMRK